MLRTWLPGTRYHCTSIRWGQSLGYKKLLFSAENSYLAQHNCSSTSGPASNLRSSSKKPEFYGFAVIFLVSLLLLVHFERE